MVAKTSTELTVTYAHTMDIMFWISIFLLCVHCDAYGLICNYCYRADVRADCHLNVLQCEPEHVCSVETSVVTYRRRNGNPRRTNMYRMGCEHYSLCKDRVISGPGPYGYHVTSKICCCNHLCEEADGVGRGQVDECIFLDTNYTQVMQGYSGVRGYNEQSTVWQVHYICFAHTAIIVTHESFRTLGVV